MLQCSFERVYLSPHPLQNNCCYFLRGVGKYLPCAEWGEKSLVNTTGKRDYEFTESVNSKKQLTRVTDLQAQLHLLALQIKSLAKCLSITNSVELPSTRRKIRKYALALSHSCWSSFQFRQQQPAGMLWEQESVSSVPVVAMKFQVAMVWGAL